MDFGKDLKTNETVWEDFKDDLVISSCLVTTLPIKPWSSSKNLCFLCPRLWYESWYMKINFPV